MRSDRSTTDARPHVISERRRADPQRDRIRLAVLAEVGLLLTGSRDEAALLHRITEIAVPELADACTVLLVHPAGDPEGTLQPVAPDADAPEIADPTFRISVPLLVRTETLGVLTLVRTATSPPYDRDDLVFAEELARRVALQIDHARLLTEQARLITELEQTNRELDRFADVASHDLKAPLRGIGHLATWIEEDLSPWVNEGARINIQLLRDRVQQLEDMIDGILSYSRAGQIVDDPVDVDVGELISEVVGLLDAPTNVSIEIAPTLPVIHTARVPLERVLLNLVGNALTHADRTDPHVQIGGTPIEGGWEFFVRDDGQGIEPEHHERIWDMFRRLRPRERIDGTGIGLSIVRRIVESVGGRAWVESELGAGATFRFTWPDAPSARWRRGAQSST